MLCNACGISYRRTVAKGGSISELEKLMLEKKSLQSSIQKRNRTNGRCKMREHEKNETIVEGTGHEPNWLRKILCETSKTSSDKNRLFSRPAQPALPPIETLYNLQ